MDTDMVVGIDVGGEAKGFHAVALQHDKIASIHSRQPLDILSWCKGIGAKCIAIDSPCAWSSDGKSRVAERSLCAKKVWCFATPTEERARLKTFYSWVFNGFRLYEALSLDYPLYRGETSEKNCMETFPHAVVCALRGKVVSAKPKNKVRRSILRDLGIDDSSLPNIDFVDAAICALSAKAFNDRNFKKIGNATEGYIVLPNFKIAFPDYGLRRNDDFL